MPGASIATKSWSHNHYSYYSYYSYRLQKKLRAFETRSFFIRIANLAELYFQVGT